jgi:hypothetical protein
MLTSRVGKYPGWAGCQVNQDAGKPHDLSQPSLGLSGMLKVDPVCALTGLVQLYRYVSTIDGMRDVLQFLCQYRLPHL